MCVCVCVCVCVGVCVCVRVGAWGHSRLILFWCGSYKIHSLHSSIYRTNCATITA